MLGCTGAKQGFGGARARFETFASLSQKTFCTLSYWAHSEGHPHTEGTFTRTLVNVGDLRRNSGECQGGSGEYSVVASPKFAKLRQSSHEGAHMIPVQPGTCLILTNITTTQDRKTYFVGRQRGAELRAEEIFSFSG